MSKMDVGPSTALGNQSRKSTAGKYAAIMMIVAFAAFAAFAQDESKEMRTLRLQLQAAQLQLDQASVQYSKADAHLKEAQELFKKGVYSKTELSAAEDDYNQSKLARDEAVNMLERTRLNFLNNALSVTLEKASLYLDAKGDKHAVLVVRNSSNVKRIIDEDGKYSQQEKAGFLTIENLRCRLLCGGTLIGRPFEYRLPNLALDQMKSIDFILQRDTDAVTVELAYGDTLVELPVYLEKEAKDDRLQVTAMQFSKDGEAGTQVAYTLELERFVDDDRKFSLGTLGLPSQVFTPVFSEINDQGGAAENVSSIRFNKGTTRKTIRLTIAMPKEIPKDMLNKKLSFQVTVLDQFSEQRLAAAMAKKQGLGLTARNLDSAAISYETLELVPRGRAELTVSATNLFLKVKMGEPITFEFELQNAGTVPLDQVRIYTTLPQGWSANVKPEKDIDLDVEAKKKVAAEAIPATDAVAGDYEIKIEAKTLHEGRDVASTPKIMRIQMEGRSNFLIGAILMILLIGMIVGVAVMTIKISRR